MMYDNMSYLQSRGRLDENEERYEGSFNHKRENSMYFWIKFKNIVFYEKSL